MQRDILHQDYILPSQFTHVALRSGFSGQPERDGKSRPGLITDEDLDEGKGPAPAGGDDAWLGDGDDGDDEI